MKAALVVLLALCCAAMPAAAEAPQDHCVRAAKAAASARVPADLLLAVSLTETGRAVKGKLVPWPWTVNVEGRGYWFDSRAEAEQFVLSELSAGRRSIDVGCFQVNLRWHPDAFESPRAGFDALANARYAARFLESLLDETGDRARAIAHYHSRDRDRGGAYAARVEERLARADVLLAALRQGADIVAAGGIALASLIPAGGGLLLRAKGPILQ